jgi:hypothetical protein
VEEEGEEEDEVWQEKEARAQPEGERTRTRVLVQFPLLMVVPLIANEAGKNRKMQDSEEGGARSVATQRGKRKGCEERHWRQLTVALVRWRVGCFVSSRFRAMALSVSLDDLS